VVILDYEQRYHKKIIHACVLALKQGKVLAYPTDTSYGLAVDAENIKAVKTLYQIKGRSFNKPVHVVVPSVAYAKKIVKWEKPASDLAKKFWPGALTLVLKLKMKSEKLKVLSANSGWLGIRMPKNQIALDLAKKLGRPITATSANVSGKSDCYSAEALIHQFQRKKFKPDFVINAGKLPKRKPSTVVKIDKGIIEILRQGSILKKQITNVIKFPPSPLL
jgi:L-threonylcarbamoyladenylate synthase